MTEKIIELFDEFLLLKTTIRLNNKILQKGILKNISIKHNIVKIMLMQGNKIKNLEYYYPFKSTKQNNQIIFSYLLTDLNLENIEIINTIPDTDTSKFYNNQIQFIFTND